MAELIPATSPSLLAPLTDPAGGSAITRLRMFAGQAAVRRVLPWFLGLSAIGGAALAWQSLAPSPQRVLYTQLDDGERAKVAASLDKSAITYNIDNQTGAVSVAEGDYYRARMLAASDGALATPESGAAMLDKLPMGASRTLEGEHLRAAREHDLMLTIAEIDGVESVRVHLAESEKSVFVRDNSPPTASVMVRLASGRQLSDGQVSAIVNLVAASVPGMTPDAVRVADQHGRLLTDRKSADSDRLEMQSRLEEKLQGQISQLLTPMLGDGNFSSEIQVELDMDQVTSAHESYDKAGAVRSETQQQSSTAGPAQAGGVPGVMSNTPPPAATASPGPPLGSPPKGSAPQGSLGQGTALPAATVSSAPQNGEASTTRNYELGREVAVANTTPGKLKRLSVAVAISAKALKNNKADLDQIKQLVSAAVGLDAQRGDQVAVIARNFSKADAAGLPFYESGWFASVLRNGAALVALLLVLMLGVRPLIKALRRPGGASAGEESDRNQGDDTRESDSFRAASRPIDPVRLSQQVGRAQQIVAEKPEDAVAALRQMLGETAAGGAA
jgi:flagellar M-ring protein FliF